MEKNAATNPSSTRVEGAPPPYSGPSGSHAPFNGLFQQPTNIEASNMGVNSVHTPYSPINDNNAPFTGGFQQQPTNIGASNIGVYSGNNPYTSTGGNNVHFRGSIQRSANTGAANIGVNSGQREIIFVANPATFSYRPMHVVCPNCRTNVITDIKSDPSAMSCMLGGLLLFFGCFYVAWVPCGIKELKNVEHTCPVCRQFIGRYKGKL